MRYRRLGRTNLKVSVLSLGSGGPNRFGQVRVARRSVILNLIQQALDLGVNFFDTSSVYARSETMLGVALRNIPRDRYYLATKVLPRRGAALMRPEQVRPLVERSLKSLQVDDIDLLQLQRVTPGTYRATVDRLMPELDRLRSEGKIRFLGITEATALDPQHRMLQLALDDNVFDTFMLAYHPGNTAAAETVIPGAQRQDIGVIAMAVARHFVPRTFGQRLRLFSRTLVGLTRSPPNLHHMQPRLRSLGATLRVNPATKISRSADKTFRLPATSYTFAASHPAVATVLTGTNDPAHLKENLTAVLAPPLKPEEIESLQGLLRSV